MMRPGDHHSPAAPPTLYNLGAEAVVLGILLLNDKRVDEVAGFLQPRHFFNRAHGRVYAQIVGEAQAGRKADIITLIPQVENDEAIKASGGRDWLVTLTRGASTAGDLVPYGRQVFDLASRRDLIAAADLIKVTTTDAPIAVQADDLAVEAERLVAQVIDERRTGFGGVTAISASVDETLKRLDEAIQRGGAAILRFGLPALEEALGALEGNVLVLAGRPGSGKSSLAGAIAKGAAERGVPTGFVSAEMTREELTQRWLAEMTGVPYQAMRKGKVDVETFQRIAESGKRLSALPLFIREGSNGWPSVRSDLRYLRRRRGVRLAIVDYLQLLAGDDARGGEGRVAELSVITREVKATAKDLGMTIILLSQLSRAVESREDKRPQLHDLRESGSIEQDADAVVCLYREEYYLRKAEPAEGTPEHFTWQTAMAQARGLAEAIVRKNRHGDERTVKLLFNAATAEFRPAPTDGAAGDQ
jgi:replicative DNA helicase